MDTTNWLIANWVLTAIGTIGGLPILVAVGRRMLKYFRPLKIIQHGTASCEYNTELREYVVIVRQVEIEIRKPVTIKARCIQLKNDKNCYPSVENRFRIIERIEQSSIEDMQFAPEIYDEDSMPEDLRNKGTIKGRMIFGRCRSKEFLIARINVIGEGGIVVSK